MVEEVNYSTLERIIHRLAFSGSIQLTAADIEEKAFSSKYDPYQARRPIFITSLPRAGTTLMLNVLNRFPTLAAHTYRDMPFVMAPILWSMASRKFRRKSQSRERAHGDGVQVDYDSPEAFEEILWRAFWPYKYRENKIMLWTAADADEAAREFFREHFKKVVALRRPGRTSDGRYLSKNNGNLARLDLIPILFPDASIVVPVRNPIDHAHSLLNQHRNFYRMQQDDSFVRRYMEDIGHYEFGELHRPVDFNQVDTLLDGKDSGTLDYWLAYWVSAFNFVAARVDKLILVSYEELCTHGREALVELCQKLEVVDEGAMAGAAALFRQPPPTKDDTEVRDRALLEQANAVYKKLLKHARSSLAVQ